MNIAQCPCCKKVYTPVLERYNGETIQKQFPNAPLWQREQLISGICSKECWDKFLGVKQEV